MVRVLKIFLQNLKTNFEIIALNGLEPIFIKTNIENSYYFSKEFHNSIIGKIQANKLQKISKFQKYIAKKYFIKARLLLFIAKEYILKKKVSTAFNILDQVLINLYKSLEINRYEQKTLVNLCKCLKFKGETDSIIDYYKVLTDLYPENQVFWMELGYLLGEKKLYDEALSCLNKSIELNPKSKFAGIANRHKSFLFLFQYKFEEGWEALKDRYDHKYLPLPENVKNLTNIDENELKDKTVLIFAEEGLGDEISKALLYNNLIKLCKECHIACEPRLESIFKRSFPDAVIHKFPRKFQRGIRRDPELKKYNKNYWNDKAKFDYYCLAMDLPSFFRKNLNDFKKSKPFLIADKDKVEFWKNELEKLPKGLNIGICWRSGLINFKRKKDYLSLDKWMPIFSIENVNFINLQYDGKQELEELKNQYGMEIINFKNLDLMNDFENTAALIKNLDIIISAPTNISEFSGALGCKTWRVENSFSLAKFSRLFPDSNQDLWFSSITQLNADPVENIPALIELIKNKVLEEKDAKINN